MVKGRKAKPTTAPQKALFNDRSSEIGNLHTNERELREDHACPCEDICSPDLISSGGALQIEQRNGFLLNGHFILGLSNKDGPDNSQDLEWAERNIKIQFHLFNVLILFLSIEAYFDCHFFDPVSMRGPLHR